MARAKIERIREHRIEMEIVVDAYGPEERAMGWHCHLEDKMAFPFAARARSEHPISPLIKGEKIEVLGMAPAEVCQNDMFVKIRWNERWMAVPLSQLTALSADHDTLEAVADWHYWISHGYCF
jgi:hypothetical protein